MRFLISLFILSACYVEDGQQGEVKSSDDAIEDNCTEEKYEYLRFELEGDKKNTNTLKKVRMSFRVSKSDLEDCKIRKVESCIKDSGLVDKFEVDSQKLSKTTLKYEEDFLTVRCMEGEIFQIIYQPDVPGPPTRGIKDKKTFRFYGFESESDTEGQIGKRLESYQDSQCWPESKSQCEAGGAPPTPRP